MVHLARNGTSGHVCPDTWPEVMCLSNWGLAGSIWGSEMSVQVCIDTSQFADVEVIAESSVQWSQVLDGNLHWFHRYTIKEHQDYWNQCNNRTYDNRCYRVVWDCSSLKSRWLLAVTEVYVLHWHVNVSINRHRAYGVVGLSRSLSTNLSARGVRFNSGCVHFRPVKLEETYYALTIFRTSSASVICWLWLFLLIRFGCLFQSPSLSECWIEGRLTWNFQTYATLCLTSQCLKMIFKMHTEI